MFELNQKNYAQVARRAAAEGCVLLKNDEKILPLKKGTKAAVFGIGAFYYYKGGLGSGGLVNTKYVDISGGVWLCELNDIEICKFFNAISISSLEYLGA